MPSTEENAFAQLVTVRFRTDHVLHVIIDYLIVIGRVQTLYHRVEDNNIGLHSQKMCRNVQISI